MTDMKSFGLATKAGNWSTRPVYKYFSYIKKVPTSISPDSSGISGTHRLGHSLGKNGIEQNKNLRGGVFSYSMNVVNFYF